MTWRTRVSASLNFFMPTRLSAFASRASRCSAERSGNVLISRSSSLTASACDPCLASSLARKTAAR